MRVLLVDPSLFTAPYDAALDGGLRAAGITPRWAVRDLRPREEADLPPDAAALRFYPLSDGRRRRTGRMAKLVKGVEHAAGLARLARLAQGFDLVHFQWAVLPSLDRRAIARIRRGRPVVLTIHDTTPFNGASVGAVQRVGFDRLFDVADRLIVHTEGARDLLIDRGVAAAQIAMIPHGPLALRCTPRPATDKAPGRWRIVLFGRLQSYKGVDPLVEALGLLSPEDRARIEVVIAGEPMISLAPILTRAAALGLNEPTLRIRPGRLDDQAMADLLGSADAFVFPYRAIEASGVLFLVAGLRKWLIASALGAFVDAIGGAEGQGALVPPGDAAALAQALVDSIGRVPIAAGRGWAPDWAEIGARTAALYREVLATRG